MKNIKTFILILIVLSGFNSFSQNLSWRLVNPRIIRVSNNDRFEFEVEVKANVAGYYYSALQATINTTATGSYYPFTTSGAVFTRKGLSLNSSKYGDALISVNASGRIGITLSSSYTWDPYGSDLIEDHYDLMPTTWSTLGTFKLTINTSYTGEVTSMVYNTGLMDVNNFYQDPALSGWSNFPTPYTYGNNVFQNLFLGRIYCNALGWSQVGGPTNNVQYLDWTTAVNTSVFDTNQAGGHASIAVTGAKAAKLRIHGAGLTGHDVAGGRLEIAPTGQLTCSGATEINLPKGLWISSSSSGTGSFIDNGTIVYNSASALVQRYLDPYKWHGSCIPLTQTRTNPYLHYYMKYYNNTLHRYRYVIADVNPDSLLNSDGIGYMMWSDATTNTTPVSPVGELNTGAMSIPVTRSAYPGAPGEDYDDWNMIGNPYPSAVDLSSANITWNAVIQEAYFWNPGGGPPAGNFTVYIKAGGGSHTKYAPAQQGFFVRHDTVSTASTSFNYVDNTVRTHNTEAYLKEDLADMLWMNVANSANSYSDLGIVRFAEGTTAGLDENIDALKLTGDADAPQMYFPVPGDKRLHVNVLPWTGINQVVPMSFTFSLDASVTITASNIESFRSTTRIYLEDKKEAKMHELTVDPAYPCTASPNDDPNRFVLHFYNPAFGVEDKNLAGMQIYSFDEYLYVRNLVKGTTKGTIQMYDLLGRKVFQGTLKDMELNKYLPGVNEGYYMVRVVTEDNSYTQKVYLK